MRVTKIHHLVEQLVDDDKVVPDAFLLEFFEVFGEDLNDLVKEEEDLGGVCVALREGEEVEIIVADVKILEFRKRLGGQVISQNSLSSRMNFRKIFELLLQLVASISWLLFLC